jgi:hypothetical protein
LTGWFIFSRTAEEWSHELKGFIENGEFPCVGAWDGFHVYVSTTLKICYSFKKRYSVSNMGFIGYNKRFMYAGVGAPGSTRDSRLLQNCDVYSKIEEGNLLPKTSLNLHPYFILLFFVKQCLLSGVSNILFLYPSFSSTDLPLRLSLKVF